MLITTMVLNCRYTQKYSADDTQPEDKLQTVILYNLNENTKKIFKKTINHK